MARLKKNNTYGKSVFREPDLPAREEKVQETIQAAIQGLIAAQGQESMNIWEFLYNQSRYIKEHWWLLQALLLVGLYVYVRTVQEAILIRQVLGIGAPLFIILVIPELWKNRSCNAMDIESATMYTLRQLYCARLTLFAGVDLLLLTTFCLGATASNVVSFRELLIQFVLPVNVTCCICLTCLFSPRGGHQAFSLALCLAFGGIWREIVGNEKLYQAITVPTWTGMLILSFAYMIYCVFRGQRKWGKILEEKMTWS